MRTSLIFFAILAVFARAANADQVTLKNGDRLTGTVIKADAKTLLIKTDFAGEVTLQWDAITAIESSQALHLELKDGQTIVGVVSTQDGKFNVAGKETGPVSAAKDAVVAVRNDAEQQTRDTEIARLRHPRLTDLWSGLVNTGLSLTRGNSDTLTYALTAKAARVSERDKITVYSTAIYAKNGTPSVTSAHAIRGGIRGDLNFSEKLFAFGFTDFEYDALQHLDLRNVLGGGVGYHLVKTKNTTFDLFGGASFNQEYFGAYTLTNPLPPPATLPQPAVTRKSAEIVAGEELGAKLNSRTTLSEKFSLYPNVSDIGQYRWQFDTTAATKLKNWLGWQVTFSNRYISNPPSGLKGNDLLLSTGLRLTFGKGAL